MLTRELETVTKLGDNANITSPNYRTAFQSQKLIVKLKSDWSQEYIFWNSSIQEYDRISQSGALKENHGKVKLSILTRKLKELMNENFVQIESEINELITLSHNPNPTLEYEELEERYWDLQNEIQHFRKQTRNFQIMILQHINRHLPLFIY